jgi:hypothetical protein
MQSAFVCCNHPTRETTMTNGEFFSLLAYASERSRDDRDGVRRCIEEAGIVAGSQAAIIDVASKLGRGIPVTYKVAMMEMAWEKHRRAIEHSQGRIPCSLVQ